MNYIIKPAFEKNNIPIVLASDDNYVPFLAVTLKSIYETSSLDNYYDIIILERNISDTNKDKLKKDIPDNLNNISLRFIDIVKMISGYNFQVSKQYPIEIYFRLFIPTLLSEYSKVLYIDCDLVLLEDIANLYNIDIGNNYLGAVRDIGMLLYYFTDKKIPISKTYFSNDLSEINSQDYFNSGVLIMNLVQLRINVSFDYVSSIINRQKWRYPDQDALNIACANHVFFLDMKWNVVPETHGLRTLKNILQDIPDRFAKEYIDSRKNIGIIHYAMLEKPWKYTLFLDVDLMKYFWKYAAKSIYGDYILSLRFNNIKISELEYILGNYYHEQLHMINSKNNVHFVTQSKYFFSRKNIPCKLLTLDYDADGIIITGTTSSSNQIEKDLSISFEINNNENIPCIIKKTVSRTKYKGNDYEEELFFEGKIPYPDNEQYEIRIKLLLNGQFVYSVLNYGSLFPVDRIIKKQYCRIKDFKISASEKSLIICKLDSKKFIASEKEYLSVVYKKSWKSFVYRKIVKILKLFFKKPVWLISDTKLLEDNGIAFFDYMQKFQKKKIKTYFVVARDNMNLFKLKGKKNILYYKSFKFKFIFLISSISISSMVDWQIINPFGKNKLYSDIINLRKFIFLQHGIITQNLSREHNKFVYNASGFVTSAKKEYENLLSNDYFYKKSEVWLTGLPRFDTLFDDRKKIITIMPTWRAYLYKSSNAISENFRESSYFKFYNSLLTNERLINAAKKFGYRIAYKSHPLFLNTVKYFDINEKNVSVDCNSYKETYANSNLIITDYSSAIFDFLYLRKPIIYAHFDKEEFFSGKHCYDESDFDYEEDGFGEEEFTLEGLIDRIIEYMENDCKLKEKYRKRIDSFFEYNDRNNCQRVFEKIYDLQTKM